MSTVTPSIGTPDSAARLAALDALVSDPKLQPAARAVLLLRVCVVAQALRPDVLERYWDDLKSVASHLPRASHASFEGLRDTIEPPTPASLGGFAGEIAGAVEAARGAGSADATLAALAECERRIEKRRWPAGKQGAWEALVRAWLEVDRAEGLSHLRHLKRTVQTNLLIRENDRAALSSDEWHTGYEQAPEAVRGALDELLVRDDPHLDLPADVVDAIGGVFVRAMFEGDADDREAESKRERAWNCCAKLVRATAQSSPDAAGRLLERWLEATMETELYAEQWPSRFLELFRVVAEWCSHPAVEPRLAEYVSSNAPAHLRDAVLVHAAALRSATAEEADAAWAALEPTLTDREPAEHWFLLTLLRSGLREHALELARRSPHAEELLPCLRRAWLYVDADSARAAISAEEVAEDEIADFLMRSPSGRVQFLRERTRSGDSLLPEAMWRPPSVLDVASALQSAAARRAGAAVGTWYQKNEPAERQFGMFVQIYGYGQHLYEHFDPILLQTLVAWDDAHPGEVVRVANRMWDVMRDQIKPNVRLDIVRNDILGRCEGVLGAHPETVERFVKWVDDELVKKPVQQQEGDTIYTFKLGENAPFLFALLAAGKVASVSAERCDEILRGAIRLHPASDELLSAAAKLYASDKGVLASLQPPVELERRSQLEAWQLGVAETALGDVLAALVPVAAGADRAADEVSSAEGREPCLALFVFNSDTISDEVSGAYGAYAEGEVLKALSHALEPEGGWSSSPFLEGCHGDLFESSMLGEAPAVGVLGAWLRSRDDVDATRLARETASRLGAGESLGYIPYAVGVSPLERAQAIAADEELKEEGVTGYVGLLVLGRRIELDGVARELHLPLEMRVSGGTSSGWLAGSAALEEAGLHNN